MSNGTIYVRNINGKKYYTGQKTVGYDESGERIIKSFSSYRKSEVVDWMNDMQMQIHQGIDYVTEDIPFGQYYKNWIYAYKLYTVSAATFDSYERLYRLHIKGTKLYKIPVKKLKNIDAQSYFNERINYGGMSEYQSNRAKMKLSAVAEQAIIDRLITFNPFKGVKIPTPTKTNSTKVYSAEEQKKIIDYLDMNNFRDQAIKFCFATGLRLGELLALKWTDWDGKNIDVNKQYIVKTIYNEDGTKYRKKEYDADPKTLSSHRIVPIPQEINNMLENIKHQQRLQKFKLGSAYLDYDIIFATEIGDYIERKVLLRRLKTISKQLGVPQLNLRSVRHSYATRLFELGIQPKTVQTLLGHAEYSTTMDIYTHVMKDKKDEAAETINNLFKTASK